MTRIGSWGNRKHSSLFSHTKKVTPDEVRSRLNSVSDKETVNSLPARISGINKSSAAFPTLVIIIEYSISIWELN